MLNFSLKSFGGSENSCTFASAFASERGLISDRQVLFDRITWNREVVVQEASPLMFFLIHYAVYGYINANRPILFFSIGIMKFAV